jgi:hypothetical protein
MKREALRHPKMLDFSGTLDITLVEAVGYITFLTDFVRDNAPQGNVGKWSNCAIARACMWPGNADEFVGALVQTGWLDEDNEHRLLVHDWHDHCENWVKAKLSRQGLKVLTPIEPKNVQVGQNGSAVRTAERTAEATAVATAEPSPPRDPYLDLYPDQTKPIPRPTSASQQAAPPDETFRFVLKNNQPWVLPRDKLDEYRATYGDKLDLDFQLRKAAQWTKDNPAKRKTEKGMGRFLNNWLSHADASDGKSTDWEVPF